MTNPIKIFVFPTHCTKDVTPGVDYVRMILPMKELQKDPRFIVTIFDNTQPKELLAKLDWRQVAKDYDILYLNYLTLPWDFALIGMLFRKEGKKIVFDIDDLIWEIQEDNSSYNVYAPGSDGRAVVTDIINECDYVTVTNGYLRNALVSYTKKTHDKVVVLPNYIDLNQYAWRANPQPKQNIRISYFGSSSHFNDLAERNFIEGMAELMKEYPNLEFHTIGAMIGQFKKSFGMRYLNDFGHQDIYTWIKMFPDKLSQTDIFATPLVESTYCKSKSSIKYLEMSSTGLPGAWQNIRQYSEIVDGKNGFLCSSAKDWYKNLKKLIDSPELRHKVGQNALKTIQDKWTIQGNIHRHADFFAKIMLDK